jgi:AmmeMemoRadiSam system protein B/AmmeMemoRadiSam system protein A
VAIVVPHAGYIFSGQIAADGFRQVSDAQVDVVVLLGTNHTTPGFTGISVQPKGAYQTPLGPAAVDEAVAAALLAENRDCTTNTGPQDREHSVEVQVPFVQILFPKARIVPAVIGAQDPDTCRRFGETLARVLKGRRSLIVASSDLSHYPEYETAVSIDRKTLEAIAAFDLRGLDRRLRELERTSPRGVDTCACGEAPIMAAAAAAKSLGASRGIVVSYANSGDTLIGELSRVVGYGAVAYCTGSVKAEVLQSFARLPAPPTAHPLQADDKKALLAFAREAIRRYLTTDTLPLPRGFSSRLQFRQGAFVTLKKQGQLRGCIGHMAEDSPLIRTVGSVALEAAFNDSRFTAVKASEFDELEIEVSVLTPARAISGAGEIVIGRDGVILAKGGRSAVFLPQVATEQGWDIPTLLDNLCRKAGLPDGAWKSSAQLLTFQAEVFHEGRFQP